MIGEGCVVGYDYNVSRLEVGLLSSSFSCLLEVLEVLRRPSLPKVVDYGLARRCNEISDEIIVSGVLYLSENDLELGW